MWEKANYLVLEGQICENINFEHFFKYPKCDSHFFLTLRMILYFFSEFGNALCNGCNGQICSGFSPFFSSSNQ